MINIVKARKPHTPEIGDYMFGGEYIMAKPETLLVMCNLISLSHFGYNPFKCLNNIGVLVPPTFKWDTTYCDDPYALGRVQYGIVPDLLLTVNAARYQTDSAQYEKMAVDKHWNRDVVFRNYLAGEKPDDAPQWVRSMMGSGYTTGTLPSDGHGSIEVGYVGLNNGDALRCYVWEWYNK